MLNRNGLNGTASGFLRWWCEPDVPDARTILTFKEEQNFQIMFNGLRMV